MTKKNLWLLISIKVVFAHWLFPKVTRDTKAVFVQFGSGRKVNFATLTTNSKVLLALMTPMIPRIDRAKSARPTKMPIQAAAWMSLFSVAFSRG